jgi:two-component system nitrogen regulation sensor histidine kinase GlnL
MTGPRPILSSPTVSPASTCWPPPCWWSDAGGLVRYANPAAEHLLEVSVKSLSRQKLAGLFTNGEELGALCAGAGPQIRRPAPGPDPAAPAREPLHVHSIVSAAGEEEVVVELRENVQQLKLDREERLLDQSQANKELIRNLAHEIKNPLGGIRGAAQLLELELPDVHLSSLREYTQVIIKEADRLQTLVDRLLAPHRRPHIVGDVNIHEVCERVRSLVLAEFPSGLASGATTTRRFPSSAATRNS